MKYREKIFSSPNWLKISRNFSQRGTLTKSEEFTSFTKYFIIISSSSIIIILLLYKLCNKKLPYRSMDKSYYKFIDKNLFLKKY